MAGETGASRRRLSRVLPGRHSTASPATFIGPFRRTASQCDLSLGTETACERPVAPWVPRRRWWDGSRVTGVTGVTHVTGVTMGALASSRQDADEEAGGGKPARRNRKVERLPELDRCSRLHRESPRAPDEWLLRPVTTNARTRSALRRARMRNARVGLDAPAGDPHRQRADPVRDRPSNLVRRWTIGCPTFRHGGGATNSRLRSRSSVTGGAKPPHIGVSGRQVTRASTGDQLLGNSDATYEPVDHQRGRESASGARRRATPAASRVRMSRRTRLSAIRYSRSFSTET